jgi:L-lactate dehydrogenase (cytochrome)
MTPSAYRTTDRDFPRIFSLDDFERAARRILPRPIFGYVAGGAEDNRSSAGNRSAFRELALVPRVLRDVSRRDAATSLLGRDWKTPFGIAPMGLLALSAFQGDLACARAADKAGIPFVIAASSLLKLEDQARAAPSAWFQAYLPGEPERIRPLLERVAGAGIGTLAVTVDMPVAGNRENLVRAGFNTPLRPTLRLALDGLARPRWLAGTLLRTLLSSGVPHFENSFAERGAPILSRTVQRDFEGRESLDWSHLALVRDQWRGRLVIKGILHPDDAARARELGADAIWVSNHGGRQLDGAIAPLLALPAVIAAAGELPVLLDSGVRRGSDVLKALALGASFVFVGRPFNFAAAVGGERGVAHAIRLLIGEIDRDMALLGIQRCGEMSKDFLRQTTSQADTILDSR